MKKVSVLFISIILVLLCTVPAFAQGNTVDNDYFSFSVSSEWNENISFEKNPDLFVEQYLWSQDNGRTLNLNIKENEINLNIGKLNDSTKEKIVDSIVEDFQTASDDDSLYKINYHTSSIIKINDYDCLKIGMDSTFSTGGISFDMKMNEYILSSKNHIFYFATASLKSNPMTESESDALLNTFNIKEELPAASFFTTVDKNFDSGDDGEASSSDSNVVVGCITILFLLGIVGLVVFLVVRKPKSRNPVGGFPQAPFDPTQQFNQPNNAQPPFDWNPPNGQQNNSYPPYNQNFQYGQQDNGHSLNNQDSQYGWQNNSQPPQNQNFQYDQQNNGHPLNNQASQNGQWDNNQS